MSTENNEKNKNNKQGKSLYQRLRELPLSKDKVGQSFIIVRGGQVMKPGNGDDGGGEKDG